MNFPLLRSSGDAGLYAMLGVPAGIVVMFFGFREWNKFRKVADIPTSKARSMAAGLVELNGNVVPIQKLKSPISGADCVYYKVEHQVYVRNKRGGSWVTTSVKKDFQNFYLKDETGKVEIDPRLADIDIPSDKTTYRQVLLQRERDIEYWLAPGDIVYALGTAKIKPGVKSAVNEENFIVTQGEGDKFYYISDKKEKDVQGALKNKAMLMIGGGALITVASLAYLLWRLKLF